MGTSWNPSTLQTANGALSGGNLTYTKSGNGDRALRSLHSIVSGDYYAEILLNGSDDTFGVLNGTPTLPATTDFFPGTDNNGICAVSDGRVIKNLVNLVGTGGLGTQGVGQRICIAVRWKTGTALFWARIQNGLWNNNGSADPATGTGGFDISSLGTPGTTPIFLSTTTFVSGGGTTLKSATSEWAFSPPSGFLEINAVYGTVAQTLGAATSAAAGTVRVSGALAQTLGAVTLAGTGTLGNAINGTLNQGLGAVTSTATGTLLVAGSLAQAMAPATLAATGAVRVSGTLANTLAAVSLSAAGTLPPASVTGGLNATLENATLVGTGTAVFGWSDVTSASGLWSDVTPASGVWS